MIIKNKNFKTISEQIKLLKSNGLIVSNEFSLEYYLKYYNYQNFINGYNDPFMKNFQRRTNKYAYEAQEISLIELFNFDRSIGPLLLSNIQNIERRFSTALAYIIGQELQINSINFGLVFNLNIDTCSKIFNCNIIDQKLQNFLSDNFKKNDSDLKKKYKCDDIDENWLIKVPIWTLSIYWSFGDAISIFSKLNKEVQKKVMTFGFVKYFINTD